jgi:hypothetical protein
MGGVLTKPSIDKLSQEELDKFNKDFDIQTHLSKDVATKIIQLNDIIKTYNTNDSEVLLTKVKEYHKTLTPQQSQALLPIENKIQEFHKYILDNLDNSMNYNDKLATKTKLLGNSNQLFNVLSNNIKTKINKDKDDLLKGTFLAKDDTINKGLDSVFTNISTIRAKYKYFEHEYININLFLIIFIQHTHNVINDFIKDVIVISSKRDQYRQQKMNELISLLVNILNASELDIKPSDFDMINGMMKNLEETARREGEELSAQLGKSVINAQTQLNNPPSSLGNFSGGKGSKKQTGGFIRDHSTFPQAFYDLSKI